MNINKTLITFIVLTLSSIINGEFDQKTTNILEK